MSEINPDAGSRNWTRLVVVKDGAVVKDDNAPLECWVTDGGQRPSDEWLASQGYYGVVLTDPPVVDEEEGYAMEVDKTSWVIDEQNKTVTQSWEIIYYTEEQKAKRLEDEWKIFREQRNGLLALSDWTQLEDSPFRGSSAWLTYRQALRDLPSVTVNPRHPEWPIAPQEGG